MKETTTDEHYHKKMINAAETKHETRNETKETPTICWRILKDMNTQFQLTINDRTIENKDKIEYTTQNRATVDNTASKGHQTSKTKRTNEKVTKDIQNTIKNYPRAFYSYLQLKRNIVLKINQSKGRSHLCINTCSGKQKYLVKIYRYKFRRNYIFIQKEYRHDKSKKVRKEYLRPP
jgi:hypothetical protein